MSITRPAPITELLLQTIVESGQSLRSIELATGVKRASLMRFIRRETSLRLDIADKLAVYFRLALQPTRSNQKHPTNKGT